MPLAHYSVVVPGRANPKFSAWSEIEIIFLDPRAEPDTTILTGQFLDRLTFCPSEKYFEKIVMLKSIF